MKSPPAWTKEELEADRIRSQEHFLQKRHTEPLALYLDLFDGYQAVVEEVFERTADLTELRAEAPGLLADERRLEVLRYLSGPPVSADDLRNLLRARSLAASRFESDPALVDRLIGFIQDWHDRRRFPWIQEGRKPDQHDRKAAMLATTALLAMRRLGTMRRNQGKDIQEELVAAELRRSGFGQAPTRRVKTLSEAPEPGRFCRESFLGNRKADFIVGLPDGRTMAIECKVSNSTTNSIKRLNNDAAAKAFTWREEFGAAKVVTAVVLGGVYALRNLVDAQGTGLAIFWSHDLPAMLAWMHSTGGNGGSSIG